MQVLGQLPSPLNSPFHAPEVVDMNFLDPLSKFLEASINLGEGHALTTQAHEQNGAYIRVASEANQSLGNPVHIRLQLGAALVVEECPGILEFSGNLPGYLVGAKYGGNDSYVVPSSNPAATSRIPEILILHGGSLCHVPREQDNSFFPKEIARSRRFP
jgi:hypothetical protein